MSSLGHKTKSPTAHLRLVLNCMREILLNHRSVEMLSDLMRLIVIKHRTKSSLQLSLVINRAYTAMMTLGKKINFLVFHITKSEHIDIKSLMKAINHLKNSKFIYYFLINFSERLIKSKSSHLIVLQAKIMQENSPMAICQTATVNQAFHWNESREDLARHSQQCSWTNLSGHLR